MIQHYKSPSEADYTKITKEQIHLQIQWFNQQPRGHGLAVLTLLVICVILQVLRWLSSMAVKSPMLTTVGTPWCRAVQDAVLCVVDCPHNCFGRNLSANQGRISRKGRAKIIHDTHMSTTREHGRTTRMHKISRYNCAHAEDCEGRKKYKVSKARRIECRKPKNRELDIVPVFIYTDVSSRHGQEQIWKTES